MMMMMMMMKAIFDPWQRSLFSRHGTPGKELLLAGKGYVLKFYALNTQIVFFVDFASYSKLPSVPLRNSMYIIAVSFSALQKHGVWIRLREVHTMVLKGAFFL